MLTSKNRPFFEHENIMTFIDLLCTSYVSTSIRTSILMNFGERRITTKYKKDQQRTSRLPGSPGTLNTATPDPSQPGKMMSVPILVPWGKLGFLGNVSLEVMEKDGKGEA